MALCVVVAVSAQGTMTRRIDLGGGHAVERECWRGARGGVTCLGWTPTGFVFGDSSHELELARLFTRVRGTYVPIAPNARGDIPIAALGLALGVRPTDPRPNWGVSPWRRWIDEAGAPLPLIKERAARAEAERDAAASDRRARGGAAASAWRLSARIRERALALAIAPW